MKLVIQIVLCSVIGGLAMYCRNNGSDTLSNCRNNPRIRIKKDKAQYSLSLYSQNIWWNHTKWISCNELCIICDMIISDCNKTACEYEVDKFFNSFCASITPITHTITVTDTQTTTSNLSCTEAVTCAITTTDQLKLTQEPTIGLVSLLGVFVIVLTAVIIGWVWTCWTIKRRGRMDISSKNMTVVTNTNEEERYFIHVDTSSEENSTSSSVNNEAPQNPNSSTAIYNTIDKIEEDGPAHDVLSREKSTDRRRGRVVSNLPESEDYSRLGLCNNDLERNYQLIDNENLGLEDNT